LAGYAWAAVGGVKLYQMFRPGKKNGNGAHQNEEFRAILHDELTEHRELTVDAMTNALTLAIAEVRISILTGGQK